MAHDVSLPPFTHGFRLTPRGREFVSLVENAEAVGAPLSEYVHEVLRMCGAGMWLAQMQQFMPPRSLHEAIQAAQFFGLLELR
jgi:hypothetical protein